MNRTTITDGYQVSFHHELMRNYYWPLAWVAAVCYLLVIGFGPRVMKNRPAFNLQRPLFLWNLWLCIFSTFGVISIMPEFADTLYNKGLEASYCWMGDQYVGYNGEWVWMFHASKLLELGDTLFLVLRKKPVKFLHWYHHATVLVYASYSYRFGTASCRWGVWMNFLVHSVMYCYFAYSALGHKWSRMWAPFVTGIQIAQFVAGMYVSLTVTVKVLNYSHSSEHPVCQCPLNVSLFQSFIYLTYLVLFAHFFYVSYLSKPSKSLKSAKIE